MTISHTRRFGNLRIFADTTGCGHAYTAGIVYALANDFDDEQLLECAVELAAKIAGLKGAVPDSADVLARLISVRLLKACQIK